jgi:hypothetical protein
MAGTALGALAAPAAAAPPAAPLGALGTGDLAYTRLLIGVELLLADFYANAIAARHLADPALSDAGLALTNENEHYAFLAYVVTTAGQVPLTAADIEFNYPGGSYYTAASLTELAVTLETLALGAYLGAAGSVANPVLAGALAQITASEAAHLAAFSLHARKQAFHDAFPTALTIGEASDALDVYTS